MKSQLIPYLLLLLLLFSCQEDRQSVGTSSNNLNDQEWSIPQDWVFDGGPGFEGIPAINQPKYSSFSALGDQIRGFELACGIQIDKQVYVYPYKIMDYHEIVNENFNNNPIAITYCPLTGTAIGWQSEINNIKLDLGVSGLLYNNNLIAFDRNTGTLISQMLSRGINGSLIEEEARNINLVEMNIDSWQNLYPNAKVLSFDTGFDRDYQRYPYGNYRTVNDLLFPQQIIDKRLFAKERVLGVKESNAAKAFRFSTVENSLVESNIGGKDIIIFTGPGGSSYLQAYYAEASYGKLSFEKVSDNSKAVAKDQFNNRYDIFGQVIEGPNAGAQLGAPVAYIGYWVAWSSFEKNIPIYNE